MRVGDNVNAGSVAVITPCPVCDNRRFRFTKKGRDFWRCQECSLEKQFPLASLAELADYYEAAYIDDMYKVFTDAEEMKRLTVAYWYRTIAGYCAPGDGLTWAAPMARSRTCT